MKKLVAVIALAALVQAGCSSTGGVAPASAKTSGTAVSPLTLASFQAGVTTLGQVEATLGQPVKTVRTDSGDSVIQYARVHMESVGNRPHRVRYSTLLSFDSHGRFLRAWTRTDDLGEAWPPTPATLDAGDVAASAGGPA
ncbi:MAG TPA: hypothetical protein VME63_07290 [Dyella sp.]|uniref:hypothetical protein n=1 Tax=Dyella sp. TaxID=1869338 RepID=UPI002C05C444|nr:hypothetical protein [Dyella sp.]HTV85192.1 hypothetical protein [Dyella sp.]